MAAVQASWSSTAQPGGAANSRKKNAGSLPARPCSTSDHMTESVSVAGVEIANVSDWSRFPAARLTASHTSRVTTCSSSTIARLGS